MFQTPEFWVFVAFILLLIGGGRRGFAYITQALDAHSQKVAQQLMEAERLHDEALSLLKAYKKKHGEAIEQVERILAFAETEAMELKRSSEEAFEALMAQKEKSLSERLAIEKEETMVNLRHEVMGEAFTIIERFLSKNKQEQKKLTETSLKKLAGLSAEFKTHAGPQGFN
jgi:F-type H+-transporting ATPase subunit b